MTWRVDDNVVMASDSPEPVSRGGHVTLSVNMDDTERLEAVFHALAEGGQIMMPLGDTFWGARFGMLTDKYGTNGCSTARWPPD